MDYESRFIVGFGVFAQPTTENALSVLQESIRKHGKPAGIFADHGSQFYANKKEAAKRGEGEFEKSLWILA